jgi:hypothetical protein
MWVTFLEEKKNIFPPPKHYHTLTIEQRCLKRNGLMDEWGGDVGEEIVEDKDEQILQYCQLSNVRSLRSNVHVLFKVTRTLGIQFDRSTYTPKVWDVSLDT